jgi:hypothetical protein
MKKTTTGVVTPIALICINKSRLKVYHKETTPTYYLEKAQEFQIELFNPTSNTVLAKVELNGNLISQGGLVLRPGERIFLERYLDIPKKFMFDTYEVSNNEEVQKAIQNNGEFKVVFYNESLKFYDLGSNITYITNPSTLTINGTPNYNLYGLFNGTTNSNNTVPSYNISTTNSYSNTANGSINLSNTVNTSYTSNSIEIGSIETGRVEAGSNSNQTFKHVDKTFDSFAFHTVEYKLLPASQRINTAEDINVRRYCTSCGKKSTKTDNFCSQCGNKL